MKKNILLAVFFCCAQLSIFFIQAQTLYSTTPDGGNDGGGSIINFLPATNNLIAAKSFERMAKFPGANLIQASDSKLYGMTEEGGRFNDGVIFSFDPYTSTYTKLKDFDDINSGRRAVGSLTEASDGKLYGITSRGGSFSPGYGVIFSFDLSTSTFTKLKDFDRINGAYPGSLIQAGDGKLYGMTGGGGDLSEGEDFDGYGVIFSFDPLSAVYTKLYDFDGTSGGDPLGSLIEGSDGKLYGMTYGGGEEDAGVIFSFDPLSSTYKKLNDFNYTNGAKPEGSLTQAIDGKLYGVTHNGGEEDAGVIFSFDPVSSNYTKLKDFDVINGGFGGSLFETTDGKLYGMTYGGGNGGGVIFSFDPLSSTYTKLKEFNDTGGRRPRGSFMQATDGKLYGMTKFGGYGLNSQSGVIFSFDTASFAYAKLKDFGANESGSNPNGDLIQASDGKLYGITAFGGSTNNGVVFSFDPRSSLYKKLKDFDGTNGAPSLDSKNSLMQASDGKLYGITETGGSSAYGVIFSYDPLLSAYTKLKDFNGNDGSGPRGSLMQASDEKLYGMTDRGGSFDAGVIFSFDPSTFIYTNLKDFDDTNSGHYPSCNLIQASDGKLYGMTRYGGNNDRGVIFSYDPLSSIYKKLKDFNQTNGVNPSGSLMQASDGKLYGMTYRGGSFNAGVVFSYDPSSSAYTKLKDFDGTNGAYPVGSLMQASDGQLYGMTSGGGSQDRGIIFSYDPFSSIYTKLKDNISQETSFTTTFIEVKHPPTITLTTPANNATYLTGGNVYLNASTSDSDGTISTVKFYNDTILLHTATDTPYTFKWQKVKKGNYTLTAQATDNSGLVTTSAPVNISIVPNKPPTVNIVTPANDQTFTTPANIHFEATAADVDGRVTTVAFYNGSTLLTLESKIPYTYDWANVLAGTYTVTARATDNWGAVAISAPVTVTVITNSSLASVRPSSLKGKSDINATPTLTLAPNPVKNMVNIYTTGLQNNKQATLSIISATGITMKTMKLAGSTQTIPVNVSLLVSGVYTIKLMSGDKIIYRRFVKL